MNKLRLILYFVFASIIKWFRDNSQLFEGMMWALIVLFIFWVWLLCGCTSMKKLDKTINDTVYVHKTDSGSVNKSEAESKTNYDWWKEVVNFGKDSVYIEKTSQPIYYPVQVVREGGKYQNETRITNYDSIWNIKQDSFFARFERLQTSSKTKVLSMWQIIGICAGVCLVFFVLSKLKISI